MNHPPIPQPLYPAREYTVQAEEKGSHTQLLLPYGNKLNHKALM